MLRDLWWQDGLLGIGRRRLRRLIRKMEIEPIYRRKNASRPHPARTVYPYLPRQLTTDRPNQVCKMDLACLPIRSDFLSLVALMEWYSRKILA